MRGIIPNIELTKPLFFWLFLALPLLWFRVRDRNLALIVSRTVILSLLILTLADPQSTTEQSHHEERIFAYDLSQSVPASMRRWMESSTKQLFSPSREDRTFVFGAETKEATHWQEWLNGDSTQQSALKPGKTNLENLLTALLALPAVPRSLFLFTDGWETQGNVERLLPAAAAAGIRIYPMVPAERPTFANVAVTKLLAPTHGDSGEMLNLKVVLENDNDRAVEGTLTLMRNGQAFKTDPVKLKPGSQIFTYQTTLTEGALTSYQANFNARLPDADRYPADNQARAWVTVRAKARVLLLNGHSGGGRYLEEIVKRQGFEVTSRTADSPAALTGYKVVIFNNVEREKFSTGYLAAIERHVADGNGFVMLGAEASFAPASYRQTPIEKILPVEPKEPKREEKNRAVVLVIDKSGSMRDDNRILYAKEAAKAVARQLKDVDLLGVVGFDDSPFVVVYLETMSRLRGIIDAQIDRLKPGGQTYFLPALIEAKRQLERANAPRKHIILLSDGVTRGSQGELVDLVTVMKNELKITVSAIAISSEADIRIMKRISQYGGGLFHHVIDPSTLPQIVLEQLQDKKEEPQGDKNLIPVQERGSELLAGLNSKSYPSVLGYMETDLKKGAQLDLLIPREERKAPLLASWHYGRGKAVAFTTDLESRWSRNWIQWGGLQSFWGKILDWLSPTEEAIPQHEARVSFAANQSILDLYIYEESSADSQFRFSIDGKGNKTEGTLKKLARGHYQTSLPIAAPGDYRIDLSEQRQGRRIVLPSVGYTLAYDPAGEQPRPEFNTGLLARLAQATGGEINPKLADILKQQNVTKSYQPIRQPLIILAFLLFILEVAFRKFLFAEPD